MSKTTTKTAKGAKGRAPAKTKPEPKAKPAAKAKATPATTAPAAPAEERDLLGSLYAAYIGSDARDEAFLRSLFQQAYDAGKAAPRRRAGGPTKREIAADLLKRKEGCTTREILDATGWPAVSVPAIAKASGLKLSQTKDGRTTTYFGVPA